MRCGVGRLRSRTIVDPIPCVPLSYIHALGTIHSDGRASSNMMRWKASNEVSVSKCARVVRASAPRNPPYTVSVFFEITRKRPTKRPAPGPGLPWPVIFLCLPLPYIRRPHASFRHLRRSSRLELRPSASWQSLWTPERTTRL